MTGVAEFSYAGYNQDVWNAHDPGALGKYVAADARVHSMTPGHVSGVGLDYLTERAKSLFDAFPDIRFGIEEVIQQGDILCARVVLEGTQQAAFAGIPATRKRMKVYDFAMYRIVESRITDIWSLIDMQAIRDQLLGGPGSTGAFR